MSLRETTDVHTRNPFEFALWVSAAIMLVLGAAAVAFTATTFNDTGITCTATTCDAINLLRQLSYALTLPLILGFIITAAIALGTRALEWNARHRAAESVALDVAEAVSHETSAVGVPPLEQAVTATRASKAPKPDHQLFMRPGS